MQVSSIANNDTKDLARTIPVKKKYNAHEQNCEEQEP